MESTGVAPQLTTEEAIANLTHSDLSLRYYAAWWLGHYRVTKPEALSGLMAALEDEEDRTELGGYPMRRNAARALGKVGNKAAIAPLIKCLECSDYYVREAAAQSLGNLQATEAIPALIKLLEGGMAKAVEVPDTPHLTQPYEAVIEALGALKATTAISLIEPFLNHPVQRLQYATTRAMYQLTENSMYAEKLVQELQSGNVQLRRMALNDLGQIGYLPGAKAMALASVENSFKLIALKSLLEYNIKKPIETVSKGAMELLHLMDNLL
jgi:phycocyanobilin lyase subunit alpha